MFKARRMVSFVLIMAICASFTKVSFAASKPDRWVQNKTNWCWATIAKAMINTRTGINIPSDYQQVNNQIGIRREYCLYQNGRYITDRAQEYIVRNYKDPGTDFSGSMGDNFTGSAWEIGNAVTGMTGYQTTNFGDWGTRPFADETTRTMYIDNNLYTDSREICANLYTDKSAPGSVGGHSLLITEKTSDGKYKTWNPWNNRYTLYTKEQLFSTGVKVAPFRSIMYCENVVYFTE